MNRNRQFAVAEDELEPIHLWFDLTYANYLVLPRSVLQSMPQAWQAEFVTLLHELEEAAQDLPWVREYRVHVVGNDGRFQRDPIPHYERGRTRVPLRPTR